MTTFNKKTLHINLRFYHTDNQNINLNIPFSVKKMTLLYINVSNNDFINSSRFMNICFDNAINLGNPYNVICQIPYTEVYNSMMNTPFEFKSKVDLNGTYNIKLLGYNFSTIPNITTIDLYVSLTLLFE